MSMTCVEKLVKTDRLLLVSYDKEAELHENY